MAPKSSTFKLRFSRLQSCEVFGGLRGAQFRRTHALVAALKLLNYGPRPSSNTAFATCAAFQVTVEFAYLQFVLALYTFGRFLACGATFIS
jgi:hypothetical protein